MFSATIVRRLVSAAGALALSALLLAPQDFTAAARALLVATQDGSTSWILAVRASASGARATDFAVARPGRQV